ncbi:MAG: hypothetical protein ACRYFZ_09715 [Janthinobacterium lividum]
MSSLVLFCLRAAASRAARINTRTANRYFRAGQPTPMWAAVRAATRRAEVAKHRYFDALYEAQRMSLNAIGRLAVVSKGKSYAQAA